ncbi:MAG: PEGA domain-containing protein [Myxococcales bacterium]|nr:PEGA domain-containing protein [Myxococcales bacterium]
MGLFVALSCATSYAKPAAQPEKPAIAVDLESKPAPSLLDVKPLDAKTAAAEKKAAEKQATADKKAAAKQATADKKAAAKQATADKKAAAKQATADKKAAAKQATADKKAAAKKAAGDIKAAEQKAAADVKAAEQKAAADIKAASLKAAADVKAAQLKAAAKPAAVPPPVAAKPAAVPPPVAAKPAAVPPPVAAKPAAKPGPPQPFTVVVGPLRPLGDGNADPRAARKLLEEAVRTVPGAKLIPEATLTAAAKRAGRKDLTCADAECLAGLGELVGAQVILGGELGTLGAGQVLYLRTVDVPLALELRGTTLLLDGDARTQKNHARAAAVRALAPAAYVGSLRLDIEVAGATIYVNGRKLGVSPLAPQPLAVGTHALRVTHEQHRDFVRFIDIRFDEEARLPVPLTPLPVITDEMRAEAKRRTAAAPPPRPWYRKKWYGAAAVGAGAFLGAVIVTGIVVGDSAPWDREVTLGRP